MPCIVLKTRIPVRASLNKYSPRMELAMTVCLFNWSFNESFLPTSNEKSPTLTKQTLQIQLYFIE